MGTIVADPAYLPTTVEHMARKQLAKTEAEKTAAAAAAAADPFQPAPSPTTASGSGRLHSAQQYAKFATQTEEWEARNKTRRGFLYEALKKHDKRRKKNTQLKQ